MEKTINRALLSQSSKIMGKLKEYFFGKKSFHEYEDDFLDDDYHYGEWKKKEKKRKQDQQNQQGEYGDEWIDGVDE